MKGILSAVFLAAALVFLACNETPIVNEQQNQIDITCSEGVSYPLIAGRTDTVGTILVSNTQTDFLVTYTITDPEACFGTLHLWIGNDFLNMPKTGQGSPIPGLFPYHFDATGTTSHTFTIPFTTLNIQDVAQACGLLLNVVAHAEVDMDCDTSSGGHETAFGGNTPGPGPRWWFYAQYNVCCDFGDPGIDECKTAYGKGGWVWTTRNNANPENLPSLNLTQNRWGWAINLLATGTTTYDIWAGAGLNKIANGTKVGTLTIVWDGTNATITYNLFTGFTMSEAHLYADDPRPTTIAPGQYGNTAYFDPEVSSYSYTVPLADTNGTDGVWIVAHAVVCGNY